MGKQAPKVVGLTRTQLLATNYERELEFYKSHHRNSVNIAIHLLSIPLELLSVLMIFPSSTLFTTLSLLYCLLIGSYCSVVTKNYWTKLFVIPLHVLVAILNYAVKSYFFEGMYMHAIKVAIMIHCSSWFLQVIIGHFYIENNHPGMMNKLTIYSIIISNSLALETFINHFLDR